MDHCCGTFTGFVLIDFSLDMFTVIQDYRVRGERADVISCILQYRNNINNQLLAHYINNNKFLMKALIWAWSTRFFPSANGKKCMSIYSNDWYRYRSLQVSVRYIQRFYTFSIVEKIEYIYDKLLFFQKLSTALFLKLLCSIAYF